MAVVAKIADSNLVEIVRRDLLAYSRSLPFIKQRHRESRPSGIDEGRFAISATHERYQVTSRHMLLGERYKWWDE
jgi:hypothetical protein